MTGDTGERVAVHDLNGLGIAVAEDLAVAVADVRVQLTVGLDGRHRDHAAGDPCGRALPVDRAGTGHDDVLPGRLGGEPRSVMSRTDDELVRLAGHRRRRSARCRRA